MVTCLQVSLPVVRRFVGRVEQAALGVKVLKGVRPDQQLVKVPAGPCLHCKACRRCCTHVTMAICCGLRDRQCKADRLVPTMSCMIVQVVNDQLVELMGGQQEGLVEVKPGQTQVGRAEVAAEVLRRLSQRQRAPAFVQCRKQLIQAVVLVPPAACMLL